MVRPPRSRLKWAVALAVAASHPVLLYTFFPVVGEAINTIVLAGPVVATLLLGIRVGVLFIAANAVVSALVFKEMTQMSLAEGLPKGAVSVLVMGVVCLGADRLRRFIEQRTAMEDALAEAQRMEAIGRLAGGVAHDMNNTLNAIMGCAFALRHELAAYGRPFPDLEHIALACDRGAQLTRNLLGFARRSCDASETFSLNGVVQRVQALLARTMNKNIRFEIRLTDPAPFMVGDEGQLEQAVMNLCLNALDAMEDRGTLTVATGAARGQVSVSVSDTGPGMAESVRERAFEPFFTTKPPGKGTGLGLSMVYGTVQAMRGQIDIHTTLGVGTRLTLTFPKADSKAAEVTGTRPALTREADATLLAGRTVLLVDDEPLVLRAGARMLRAMGCQVLTAKSGREAIEVFKAQRDTIALLIVDLIMPDKDGFATAHDVLALAPRTPILLASGFTPESSTLEEQLRGRPSVGFLQKPYDPTQLIGATRKLFADVELTPPRGSRTGTESR